MRLGNASRGRVLGLVVATAEVFDEHLFYRLVVGDQDMARGMAADQVADFFGEILGVVSGAFKRLGHEDDLEAGLAGNVFRILDVAQEDQVAQAVDVSVGTENIDGLADIAIREGGGTVATFFPAGLPFG